MKENLLNLLMFAYACEGIISIIAYWPTIKDLYFHKKESANVRSYTIWTFTSGIAFLYSVFILPDLLFRIVSGIGFLLCATVLFLALRLKRA